MLIQFWLQIAWMRTRWKVKMGHEGSKETLLHCSFFSWWSYSFTFQCLYYKLCSKLCFKVSLIIFSLCSWWWYHSTFTFTKTDILLFVASIVNCRVKACQHESWWWYPFKLTVQFLRYCQLQVTSVLSAATLHWIDFSETKKAFQRIKIKVNCDLETIKLEWHLWKKILETNVPTWGMSCLYAVLLIINLLPMRSNANIISTIKVLHTSTKRSILYPFPSIQSTLASRCYIHP